jgi:pyruvate dehydrogenase E2 component (dihydrolipoyllysine-residue acetyltransferase)
MVAQVIMPQGGQDIEKGTIVRWHRKAGELVRKGEVVCEVETEKTVIEVTAPQDGVVLRTFYAEGEEAKVLSVIAVVGDPGEAIPDALVPSKVAVSAVEKASREEGQAPPLAAQAGAEGGKMRVSPKARQLAMERGVPLDGIAGTGPQGSITAEDVLAAAERLSGGRPPEGAEAGPGRTVPMGKVAKVTARRMLLSKQSIPHFYITVAVDMTAAKKYRTDFNGRLPNSDTDGISITDLVTRACVLALREFPQLNSTVKDEGTLILWNDLNVGIAAATEAGLVVPVVEGADALSLAELAKRTRQVVAAAREGRQISVAPARFTISNMGMYGVDNFLAIINPPEAAILSVSSVKPTVVPAEDGTIQVRDIMNATLSMDHRVGDGVVAARFLSFVRTLLEEPAKLG